MITDAILGIFDPVVAWIVAGLDGLPEFGTIGWLVRGAGTLDQVVPVALAVGYATSWFTFLAVALGVRAFRAGVSHITGGGGVA